MTLKVIGLVAICICMIAGMVMSAKYLKNISMWVITAVLATGLLICVSYLVALLSS